jgi:hypothetical protein
MAIERRTIFSDDRIHRFTLWREWSDDLFKNHTTPGFVQFIGLNPSTADENQDDPTIRRCKSFAKSWGYNAMCMTNLFSFITPYPNKLQVIGDDANKIINRKTVYEVASEAAIIICAWGKFDTAKLQAKIILDELKRQCRPVHHLGLNGDGTPKHPLYLRADTRTVLMP